MSSNFDKGIEALHNMEWDKLWKEFNGVIEDALKVYENAAKQGLNTLTTKKGRPVDIFSPIHSHGNTYNSLAKGIVTEVSNTSTKGRIRIAKGKADGYTKKDDNFALKWFDLGTKERHKKGSGYNWVANTNKKQGGARRHRNTGQSLGKIEKSDFFDKAIFGVRDKVEQMIEDGVDKIINDALK